jgi:DNA-directed RNA polymerase subunit L|tara:strand:- start:878 stop:1183 length:306 start_codon:yes stop_codon:yes gene_type:complete
MRFTLDIKDERHALVRMLASIILQQNEDIFVGDKVPHPLSDTAQIILDADSLCDATKVLQDACAAVVSDMTTILEALDADIKLDDDDMGYTNVVAKWSVRS